MIYLDSSITLAQLLAEDRTPPVSLWRSAAQRPVLATYDRRLADAATALGLPLADL